MDPAAEDWIKSTKDIKYEDSENAPIESVTSLSRKSLTLFYL